MPVVNDDDLLGQLPETEEIFISLRGILLVVFSRTRNFEGGFEYFSRASTFEFSSSVVQMLLTCAPKSLVLITGVSKKGRSTLKNIEL